MSGTDVEVEHEMAFYGVQGFTNVVKEEGRVASYFMGDSLLFVLEPSF
jgi:hypothetical protein